MATENWVPICLNKHRKLQFQKRMRKALCLSGLSSNVLCVVWCCFCPLLVGMGHFPKAKHVTDRARSFSQRSFLSVDAWSAKPWDSSKGHTIEMPSCQGLCTCSTDGAPEVFSMRVRWRAREECRKFLDPMEVCMLSMVSRSVDAFNSFQRVCCYTVGRAFWCWSPVCCINLLAQLLKESCVYKL